MRLCEQLVRDGKPEKVDLVVKRAQQLMPNDRVPYNYYDLLLADPYYKAGFKEEAKGIIETVWKNNTEELLYFLTLGEGYIAAVGDEKDRSFAILYEITSILDRLGETELAKNKAEEGAKLMESYLSYIAPFRDTSNEAELYSLYGRLSESQQQDVSMYLRLLERINQK